MAPCHAKAIRTSSCVLIVTGISLVSTSAIALGDAVKEKELLLLVANKAKANRNSIQTWRGTVEFTCQDTETVRGKKVNTASKRTVTFAYDDKADLYTFLAKQTGDVSGTWGAIRTVDTYQQVDTQRNGERVLMVSKRSAGRPNPFGSDFEPFMYMNMDGSSSDKFLVEYVAHWDELTKGRTVTVERTGNLVTFTIRELNTYYNRYVFDLDQGANVVEISGESKDVKGIHKRTFVKVDGTWVPKSSYGKVVNSGDRPMIREHRLTWGDHILNKPIPAGTFEPDKIGLRRGDKVRDRRTKIESIYEPRNP
jgi:hypothetical protein